MGQKMDIPNEPMGVYTGVNMTVIVSVRLEEDDIKVLEEMGLKPGPFMRDLVKKEIKRRRALEALEWADRNRVPATIDIVEEIRKDRER
jgi:hypothetical protein